MSFYCPKCKQNGSLRVDCAIDLPPDSRSDEITLALVICDNCQFKGITIYEESRRGSLDDECFEHCGYQIADGDWLALQGLIALCPTPRYARCSCETHRNLGRQDQNGRWTRLKGIPLDMGFSVRLS